jgi:hypothetical protein
MPRRPVDNPKRVQGLKKPACHFIPPIAILMESIPMAMGGMKYGPYNWNDTPIQATDYYNAILRHLFCWFTGSDADVETKVSDLAHIRACCAILIDAEATGKLIDDRPKLTASARKVIDELMKLIASGLFDDHNRHKGRNRRVRLKDHQRRHDRPGDDAKGVDQPPAPCDLRGRRNKRQRQRRRPLPGAAEEAALG